MLTFYKTSSRKYVCIYVTKFCSFYKVVSPLISLMEDQILALNNININATIISSSIPPKEVTVIQNQLIDEHCPYKMVYVTPERIAKSKRFMAKLEKAYASNSCVVCFIILFQNSIVVINAC